MGRDMVISRACTESTPGGNGNTQPDYQPLAAGLMKMSSQAHFWRRATQRNWESISFYTATRMTEECLCSEFVERKVTFHSNAE